MIINKVNYNLKEFKFPTLEKAKELARQYKKPLNGAVVLFNIMAPETTAAGIALNKPTKDKVQQILQEKGVLLIDMCDSLKDNIQVKGVKIGDFVAARVENHNVLTGSHVKDEEGNEYGVLLVPFHCLVAVVEKPDFDNIK